MVAAHWNKYVNDVGFKGAMTDKTKTFSKTNTPCGGSPEDNTKAYAPSGCLSYKKI